VGAARVQHGWIASPRDNPNEVQYETLVLSRGLRGRAGMMVLP
jgi:hypothetical protein